jgi:hypothetical protein
MFVYFMYGVHAQVFGQVVHTFKHAYIQYHSKCVKKLEPASMPRHTRRSGAQALCLERLRICEFARQGQQGTDHFAHRVLHACKINTS